MYYNLSILVSSQRISGTCFSPCLRLYNWRTFHHLAKKSIIFAETISTCNLNHLVTDSVASVNLNSVEPSQPTASQHNFKPRSSNADLVISLTWKRHLDGKYCYHSAHLPLRNIQIHGIRPSQPKLLMVRV